MEVKAGREYYTNESIPTALTLKNIAYAIAKCSSVLSGFSKIIT